MGYMLDRFSQSGLYSTSVANGHILWSGYGYLGSAHADHNQLGLVEMVLRSLHHLAQVHYTQHDGNISLGVCILYVCQSTNVP